MTRVVQLASECVPYAKTGGLGDVLGALPQALAATGATPMVCLPGHREALAVAGRTERIGRVMAPVSSRMEPCDVLRVVEAPVPTLLFCADRYFDRPHLYGPPGGDWPDNAERFVFFCRAALEWLRGLHPAPDVLHVHDWQTALAPAFLRANAALYPELAGLRTVLTIHNLAYQGRFWGADWHLLNLDPRYFTSAYVEFWGDINFLKAGLVFADAITTVSPRYATEIQTPAFGDGLDGVLRARAGRLRGILNGIDFARWNPATDPDIPAHFTSDDLGGKQVCRVALQRELGLAARDDVPVVAMVTRLAEQKGIDVALAALPDWLARDAIQLIVLGNGEWRYEEPLRRLAAAHAGRMALRLGFDEPLSHRIEAGADVFLMPSRFEPCGLNQLYSLRYGTVPVVHAVGGLDDTVRTFDPESGTGTGFKFSPLTPDALAGALDAAVRAWHDPVRRARLVHNGMAMNFSWERAAREYRQVYEALPPPVPAPW